MILTLTPTRITDEERLRFLNEYFTYMLKRSWKYIVLIIFISLIYLVWGIFRSNSIETKSMLICVSVLFPVYFFIARPRLSARRYLKLMKSSPSFGTLSSIQMDERIISLKTNLGEEGTFTWKSITAVTSFKNGIILFSGKIPQIFIYNTMLNETNRKDLYQLAEQAGVPVIRGFRQTR